MAMALFKNLKSFLGLSPLLQDRGACMLVSEQEGAEIWIDGKNTKRLTPQMIAIPQMRDVKIELKLFGHETHQVTLRSSNKLSYYYCHLNRIPLRLVVNEVESSVSL